MPVLRVRLTVKKRMFAGLNMLELQIKYSVGRAEGERQTSGELVITNWDTNDLGGLF